MRIGLIDVDGHNFPNLALMKISSFHKAKGDSVEWCIPMMPYEKVYMSKVFTFTPDIMEYINAKEIVRGGSGYDTENKLPHEIEHMCPDYSLYPQYKEAYGFLTRGCPNRCPFCIVGKKEGFKSVKVADLSEWYRGQKEIKLLDPNLLACKERIDLLSQLVKTRALVDFTQGLDARLVNDETVALLARIRIKMVHFAFDLMKNEKAIIEGLKLYKKVTNVDERKTGVYILTNFNTTFEEDMYRIRKVRELGYMPFVMIYEKDTAPQITKYLQRWCNNRIIYKCTPNFFDYRPTNGKTIRQIYRG